MKTQVHKQLAKSSKPHKYSKVAEVKCLALGHLSYATHISHVWCSQYPLDVPYTSYHVYKWDARHFIL